jgi:hypothetical protein
MTAALAGPAPQTLCVKMEGRWALILCTPPPCVVAWQWETAAVGLMCNERDGNGYTGERARVVLLPLAADNEHDRIVWGIIDTQRFAYREGVPWVGEEGDGRGNLVVSQLWCRCSNALRLLLLCFS